MKRIFPVFFSLLFFSYVNASAENATQEPAAEQISSEKVLIWHTSLAEAQKISKNSHRPIYLCFTGPEWCFWCKKLENEIHSKKEFIEKVHDTFIFVQINIPKRQSDADAELKELMLNYKVYGVPVILILSPENKELGRMSYQNTSPEAFAEQALSFIQ